MTKFFFDARYIRPGLHDGISRFSANLFAAVARKADVTAIISDEKQLEKLPKGTKWVKINSPISPLEPFASARLNRFKPDVVFSPMQTIGSLGRKFKLILTVHDLIYFRHKTPPAALPALMKLVWRAFHLSFGPERLLLANCDGVVSVSESTASAMEKNRLTRKKVTVVYNAPERFSVEPVDRKPERKLVYMGTFMGYKNVETLIRGVALVPGYTLHLLSKITPVRRTQLEAIARKVDAKVVFHNGVSDSEYHSILDSATALVSASLDEGFGIPVVEAMDRGVPVILSDIDIFKEVAGEAGAYFEPKSPEQFADRVRAIVSKPTSEKLLKEQSAKFNWDDSANRLLELVKSLS